MDQITFTINREHYTLSGHEVTSVTSLNDFIRGHVRLHGSKAMCHEGGCGACVVCVAITHPDTGETSVQAVNSCLVNILSCHKWDITTVEGVGNRKDGYHAIQERLAMFNGTQCGFCTPGWVMNMYSLYESSNKKLTMKQIENSFAGNMCRCTGYRPILDAFKTFATDVDQKLADKLQDMEDLSIKKCTKQCVRKCSLSEQEWCLIDKPEAKMLTIDTKDTHWYKAYTLDDVFKILSQRADKKYRLIAGNTGQGVYPITSEPSVQIDISSIPSLKDTIKDVNLVMGAGTTLTEAMKLFRTWSSKTEDFKYLDVFYEHLDLVAHVPVRNIGTIGGNLALKNAHHDFPSDVFVLLATVGATVTIVDGTLKKTDVSMEEFLKTDLKNKLIVNVNLPPLSRDKLIRTFKIMPRSQNAHAIVNAGFSFQVEANKVLSSRIVFGSITPSFIRAKETERILKGLDLYKNESLQKALAMLNGEILPSDDAPEPSPFCKKTLALGLFYKAVLSLCQNTSINKRYVSGGSSLQRPVSHGTQTFDTDKTLWPLNQPVPKLEALTQCSGEVKYTNDQPMHPREVHVAFVLSTICLGEILHIDATEALKLPGVIAFFTAADIPGKNSFTPLSDFDEEILASKKISYHSQPVGLIAALTHKLAVKAAGLVVVKYKEEGIPVLTIRDALKAVDKERRVRQEVSIKATERGTDIRHVINARCSIPSQYHYYMEPQSCAAHCTENGISITSATQWADAVQICVARVLNMNENKIEITVPRIGGAFGGKASRSSLASAACALVTYKLNRAATLVLSVRDNMRVVGKRQACEVDYEVGVNDSGLIQYLDLKYYCDCGSTFNDSPTTYLPASLALYENKRWNISGSSVLTDKPTNTWCRAPGTTEAFAILEHIMDRIAFITKTDPIQVRITNLSPDHQSIQPLIESFKTSSKYEEIKVENEKFNSENAWKKRGLKMSIMAFPIEYYGTFPVTVTVYHGDGSVAVGHGGIEMGQGINTKVAQVVAYTLKIPMEKVTIKPYNNFTSPNSGPSSGSITSESVAHAARMACQELLTRLQPHRVQMDENTWEDNVKKAFDKGVNLQSSYMTSPNDGLKGYTVYGACVTNVELDVLTGRHLVRQVDLIEDTGVSLSPNIDVGQIEGAFIMGLGLWTSEQLVYDKTGRLLTDRTWTYKPPGVKDIPVDFKVSFKRNSVNPAGVLRSKATGEPALVLAVSVSLALQAAVAEARKEFGYDDTNTWVQLDNPCTVENILRAISPKIEYYKLT